MQASSQPRAAEPFLKAILRSRLLTPDQVQTFVRSLAPADRASAESLAAAFVKAGQLSKFQARKLLQGTALGLVLGSFQVLAPIGKGGMGTVYLARDQRSNMLVALKVLSPKRSRDEPRLLARFRREMELCRCVSHSHVAWTYDVGVHKDVYYIAMEYIPGKSLYRVVAENGPMTVARAARLFSEIAAALEHTHNQGLVHRDLKPSNVIITPHDHAKLLDLGLALRLGESGEGAEKEIIGGQGYIVGSMDYIAPEQTEDSSKVDGRSDIYALGCSLYYVLTGKPPFFGGTALEKIQKHRSEEPPPVPPLNPSVPPAFIGILRKMMSKRPEKRYQTAEEVREELLPWAAGETPLPLDRPEDSDFREAVAVIESQDEASAEVLPVEEDDDSGPAAPRDAKSSHSANVKAIRQTGGSRGGPKTAEQTGLPPQRFGGLLALRL